MRRILVEMARQKKSLKRGGGWQKLELADEEVVESPIAEELLDLDEALKRFEMVDPIKAKLVKLRFFAGMTNAEAAGALGIGLSTAERYWTFAKAWLHQEVKR
ncbi:MAG: ECF-type sigma factor [Pirellulaceae bacterium]